jgi:phosphatidylglycerol:prolipoprotein diacylglycerol transferase
VESGQVIDYLAEPGRIIGSEGLTIWGGVLGATLGIWIYSRFARFRYGYLLDTIAPAIILAQAIGRVGCLINGCCYGAETDVSWAIVYLNTAAHCPVGTPVHPTQFYEIIYNLAVFGMLLGLRNRIRPDGSLFMIYLGMYGLWRIAIGFWRVGTPFVFGMQQAQIIGILVLLVVVPWLIVKMRWGRPEAVELPAAKVNGEIEPD